ncbi:hypothetical protein HYV86_01865 [Candidatus Woesearchaeota archaeon]|nr:hypothetical protein [Candidatus Woesearchaeota archaeon]
MVDDKILQRSFYASLGNDLKPYISHVGELTLGDQGIMASELRPKETLDTLCLRVGLKEQPREVVLPETYQGHRIFYEVGGQIRAK